MACLPLTPCKERYLSYSSPRPVWGMYTYLVQSANDSQNPYPVPCPLTIKTDQRPTFRVSSPWLSGSWPMVLAVPPSSPILINSILLSFCLVFGNSFPTCAWTTTFMIVDFPTSFSLWVIGLNHLHTNDRYRLTRNQKKSNGDFGTRFPSIFRRDRGRDSIFSLWLLLCLDETLGNTTTIL